MIIATNKCGCPPSNHGKLKDLKEICSPCCAPAVTSCPCHIFKKNAIKQSPQFKCPETPCCLSKHTTEPCPILSTDTLKDFECCPTKPSETPNPNAVHFSTESNTRLYSKSDNASTRKVVSEITQSGSPYKEIEVAINDNRVVIRTQKELIEEEYDPPCDCIADDSAQTKNTSTLPDGKNESDFTGGNGEENDDGCRTITLYPEPRAQTAPTGVTSLSANNEKKDKKDKCEKVMIVKPVDLEENPNIFLLRIRKKCDTTDKRYNIDLEFKTPRPWSLKRPLRDETSSEVTKIQGATLLKRSDKTSSDKEKIQSPKKKRKKR